MTGVMGRKEGEDGRITERNTTIISERGSGISWVIIKNN